MSNLIAPSLEREGNGEFVLQGIGARAASEIGLGIAKLQILDKFPDAWFVTAFDEAPPAALEEINIGPISCAWLAPGEWLVIGPEAEVEPVRQRCADMAGTEGLIIDLTHAKVALAVSGNAARSILAAHCPLDLGHYSMPVGAARRSMFSDADIFISRRADRDGQPCFRLIFDQTMAGYARRMLAATISGEAM